MCTIDDEDYSHIGLNTAKFILQQTEKLLVSTVETTNILIGRAKVLIQIFAGVIIADLGFIVARINENDYSLLFQVAVVFLVLLIVCISLSIRMFRLTDVNDVGSLPSKLINSELLYFDINNQELTFILNEIQDYEDRIQENLSNNRDRALIFDRILIVFGVGLSIITLYSLFTSCCCCI